MNSMFGTIKSKGIYVVGKKIKKRGKKAKRVITVVSGGKFSSK